MVGSTVGTQPATMPSVSQVCWPPTYQQCVVWPLRALDPPHLTVKKAWLLWTHHQYAECCEFLVPMVMFWLRNRISQAPPYSEALTLLVHPIPKCCLSHKGVVEIPYLRFIPQLSFILSILCSHGLLPLSPSPRRASLSLRIAFVWSEPGPESLQLLLCKYTADKQS